MSSAPPSPAPLPPFLYDAVLLVSFGGPEGPDDVLPFLENVVHGKDVPRWRLLQAAERYALFEGHSPLNTQNRALLAALIEDLNAHGLPLPVYWGNRNWHPLLADAVRQMADDGVRRVLALVTSAFGSYSGCRQYRDDIERARQAVGPEAPQIDKLRLFYNHPGFIEPMAERVVAAFDQIPAERRSAARLIYTAHSLPAAMAQHSPYERQLHEAGRLVTEQATQKKGVEPLAALPPTSLPARWRVAYQSRSGPPSQPWLESDICDYLREIAAAGGSAPTW